MAIMTVFQTVETGSIPVSRSMKNTGDGVFSFPQLLQHEFDMIKSNSTFTQKLITTENYYFFAFIYVLFLGFDINFTFVPLSLVIKV